jgi:hypothetical protein
MDELVERELTVPNEIEEVWSSLSEPEWLAEDADAGTHIRVTESRPRAILDGRDRAIELGVRGGGAGPTALSGGMLAGTPR